MGTTADGKIILTKTHNGARPFGSQITELDDECKEVSRDLRWVASGPNLSELVWKVKFTCGQCVGIIYTGVTRPRD